MDLTTPSQPEKSGGKSSAGWWLTAVLMLPILYVLSCGPMFAYEVWKQRERNPSVLNGRSPASRYVAPVIRASDATAITEKLFADYLTLSWGPSLNVATRSNISTPCNNQIVCKAIQPLTDAPGSLFGTPARQARGDPRRDPCSEGASCLTGAVVLTSFRRV